MILANKEQFIDFNFVFVSEGAFYDPTLFATPVDVLFFVLRGEQGNGPVVDGPFSYLRNNSDISNKVVITRTGKGQFRFRYKVPATTVSGNYSVVAQTRTSLGELTSISSAFQVRGDPVTLSPVVISNNSSTIVNYKASYEDLNRANTNTVLLIGHADGLNLNDPIKIRSVQSAIDLLGADMGSPLLRGVLNAYAAGARDIFIMASAPMSEYVEDYSNRTILSPIYDMQAATPGSLTFYQKYFNRLAESYNTIIDLDYIDIVVPLETSIIKTGGVDFITQLASYCAAFNANSGCVQIGVIGSRSGGISSADMTDLRANNILKNKLTIIANNQITSDIGRYVVPVYGEAVFSHEQIKMSYSSSMAASFAGMFSSLPLSQGLIRTRIPGAMSVYGSDLTHAEISELEDLGVNTIYRGKRTRRFEPYQVFASNEYTLANKSSTLYKVAQMRLVAYLSSRIQEYAVDAIGRFGYERTVDKVQSMLLRLKSNQVILDFSLSVEIDSVERGKLVFYIEVISALGIKKINFTIAAGPEAQ